MTHPLTLWAQQDAAQRVRNLLRKAFKEKERVRADLPPGWTPAKGPYMTVVSDGTPHTEPGYTREVVRVTVHAHDAPTARKLLVAADAALLSPLQVRLYRIKAGAGLIVIKDSRVGGWVASATYTVTLGRKPMEVT
ncbi:hypothetical protein C1Y63_10585 [Corynebacterium sp. 13CS0277]|uniref:hypothetical protein n=1 Tax=Corynebacterium sp. 13CS0277 TaxID=2071994 RepID=UPI000D025212|nr:hypothetical protein [Corynebacterium sp. 13CS0277]PRQ10632.1 hypothetical protein C1Y63_10585 [Corynebacterium sp. 13CS0277]